MSNGFCGKKGERKGCACKLAEKKEEKRGGKKSLQSMQRRGPFMAGKKGGKDCEIAVGSEEEKKKEEKRSLFLNGHRTRKKKKKGIPRSSRVEGKKGWKSLPLFLTRTLCLRKEKEEEKVFRIRRVISARKKKKKKKGEKKERGKALLLTSSGGASHKKGGKGKEAEAIAA